jgi:hypothetical protein
MTQYVDYNRKINGDGRVKMTFDINGKREELKITSLKIGKLKVQPYEYEETIEEDALIIKAKVKLSEAIHSELKSQQKSNNYFSVIRQGINEEPKKMRFGIGHWSKNKDIFKHEIVLIHERAEARVNPFKGIFQNIGQVQREVANTKAALDSLMNTLLEKNILSKTEVDIMNNDRLEQSWDIFYDFFKVDDIDTL